MEFDNSFEVPLPPDQAWPVLMDVRRIAPCMPGAELTDVVDDKTYKGRISVRLGPVALTFAGTVMFEDIDNAAHRERVQRFWTSPHIAQEDGRKAVDLFEAVHGGQIKAVWIIATNPVVSLPDADRVREALGRCELVVVSDCIADTDTTRMAHVKLPALAWGEKDGTVTNSERRISRQRSFLPAPGEAKVSWPGFCAASLSRSASDFTGVDAFTTSTFSAVASMATGARSAGLYGRLGISDGFTAILPTGTIASV